MSLCRLMVLDFMEPMPEAKGYDSYDLQKGKIYAEGLIEQGLTIEPFYKFSLGDFISWCKGQLNQRSKGTLVKGDKDGKKYGDRDYC